MSRIIGVVGGIASGKSTVVHELAQWGFSILDADKVAHLLYAPRTEINAKIGERFGTDILTSEGEIDRRKLGTIVFSDPSALRDLEGLVHPALRQAISRQIAEAKADDQNIVLEMALLYRWPELVQILDLVVGVRASTSIRCQRLCARNHMNEQEASQRIQAQVEQNILLSVAHHVLENDQSQAILISRIQALRDVILPSTPESTH